MNNNLKNKLKNMTNGKKYITNIINNYSDNEKVNNIEILELLQYHPTKPVNIENIDYLIMKIRKPFNNLTLHYKYKNSEIEDDISCMLCVTNIFGKYNRDKEYTKDVMLAFRNESHIGSKKQYFINNTKIDNGLYYGICENCKIYTRNITTDHYPIPFKKIFDDFVKIENIIIQNVEIYENAVNEIRITNKEISFKFRIFHDEKSCYRLLCNSCNSHFGSYK